MMFRQRRPMTALLQPIVACALLALASSTIAATVRPSDKAREAFEEAEQHIASRDWRSARIELLNAVAAEPEWPQARLELARTALQLFDPVTALEQLAKLDELGADRSRYAHLEAHARWMSGDAAKAVAILRKDPVDRKHLSYAYRILGRAQMDLGDTVAASESFDQGLQIAPRDSLLWTEVGRLRMVIANQGGAAEALDRAVALDPANVRALELRGRLVRSQFGLAAAIPWFERGLQIDPNDIPLLEEYGATLGDLGRNRDMLATARKLLSLDTRNPKAFYMQAALAARAGDFRLARRLTEKIGGAFGELPGPKLLTAICEFEIGNTNQAVALLVPLAQRQPDNEAVQTLLARALYRSGDMDGALAASSRLGANVYADRLKGRIYEARGMRDEAAVYFDRARYPGSDSGTVIDEATAAGVAAAEAARAPKQASAVIPHVRHLLAAGRFAEARNAVSALIAGNDGVADAQLLGGDVAWLAGDRGEALGFYQKARQIRFSRATMLRLVDAYRAIGQADQASATIAQYVQYNPSDSVALRMLAFDRMDRKDWKSALPLLLRVRAATGLNDSALNANIALSLSELGRHDEAVRMARLAYRIDPASLMTTRIYGKVLGNAGREPRTAADLLRKASKLAPADPAIAREYRIARGRAAAE